MIFDFHTLRHKRKHGPVGYADSTSFKPWLRDEFTFRCVYCLKREAWYGGAVALGVDHVSPQSTNPQLIRVYDNLVYACNECNSNRREQVVPDPCTEPPGTFFRFTEAGVAEPLPGSNRLQADKLIEILGLNGPGRIAFRVLIAQVLRVYAEYPDDPEVRNLYLSYFGYPDDLPNLAVLRPPGGNTRPAGFRDCFYRQRVEGRLAETY